MTLGYNHAICHSNNGKRKQMFVIRVLEAVIDIARSLFSYTSHLSGERSPFINLKLHVIY